MKNVVIEGKLKSAYENSAGYDLPLTNNVKYASLHSNKLHILFNTGIKLSMPDDIFAIVKPRSSSIKRGYEIIEGVIDADYKGFIFISAIISLELFEELKEINLTKLDSIAQIVFFNKPQIRFIEGKVENDTKRGDKGFGSSNEKISEKVKITPRKHIIG
jgi:dUTPase